MSTAGRTPVSKPSKAHPPTSWRRGVGSVTVLPTVAVIHLREAVIVTQLKSLSGLHWRQKGDVETIPWRGGLVHPMPMHLEKVGLAPVRGGGGGARAPAICGGMPDIG